jgi:hypothetical protein
MKSQILLVTFWFICSSLAAQQKLLEFKVVDLGNNRNRISWVNPFGKNLIQLNVQKSRDSISFRTFYSAIDPGQLQNGIVDEALPDLYYRMFYVLDGGIWFFTDTKQPGAETTGRDNIDNLSEKDIRERELMGKTDGDAYVNVLLMITVRDKDSILAHLPYPEFIDFKDSILSKTKDTLFALNREEVMIRYFDPESVWTPSSFIFTNRKGYVQIQMPEVGKANYRIDFFDATKKKIFQMKTIKEQVYILDKVNFRHAGWFYFEIYENNQLLEKNKFFIQEDL